MTAAAAHERSAADASWHERGSFEYRLAQPRSTHFLLVKLVAPENRMSVVGDDHDQPNVDFEACLAWGHLVEPHAQVSK